MSYMQSPLSMRGAILSKNKIFDKIAKNFLSYACIQAWLLKGFVKEFAGYSVQEVISILSGRKVKGKMLDGNAKIKMDKTENLVIKQRRKTPRACPRDESRPRRLKL